MKNMTRIALLLFAISGNIIYAQDLEKAYKKKSKEQLDIFFKNWQHNIKPISAEEYNNLSDTIKNAYQIFEVFYKPNELKQIGCSEWGDSIYQKVDYYVVQTNLNISFQKNIYYSEDETDKIIIDYINTKPNSNSTIEKYIEDTLIKQKLDSANIITAQKYRDNEIEQYKNNRKKRLEFYRNVGIWDDITHDTIKPYKELTDFRPDLRFSNKPTLYLLPQYTIALNNFLGNSNLNVNGKDIVTPNRSKKETEKRMSFINQSIKIYPGHWGGYWQLVTYPSINSIIFDDDMKYAKVYFRIVYQGGVAIVKKEKGRWIILESKLTWVE